MKKSKAIAKYCKECCGDSHKEVTLCHLIDCPLWEFRFGNSASNKEFWERMKRAKSYKNDYPKMVEALRDHIQSPDFTLSRGRYEYLCSKIEVEMKIGLGRLKCLK